MLLKILRKIEERFPLSGLCQQATEGIKTLFARRVCIQLRPQLYRLVWALKLLRKNCGRTL